MSAYNVRQTRRSLVIAHAVRSPTRPQTGPGTDNLITEPPSQEDRRPRASSWPYVCVSETLTGGEWIGATLDTRRGRVRLSA
ncbi:hypothetical protein MHPYR_470034 [uncultured Mycobacterium sp.]|uniref:Uncharacterized protein n=1 Tax=uncultured Mycobacterium sp. TaxID=171292 RepID=A0A1Y5PJU9_9MYCO|nr:hypothetical protein MHPYR_470034 [uncultured Mycobacterium sp.]